MLFLPRACRRLTSSQYSSSSSPLIYYQQQLKLSAPSHAPTTNSSSNNTTKQDIIIRPHSTTTDPPIIATINNRSVYRQHSLQDGTLRYKLKNGLPTVGVVTGFYNDTQHVETLGLLGYDFLWADAEHSSAGPDSIANLILAAERRGMPTLVRIGYGYQDIIGHSQKYLVAGAQGIILPQCESPDDVRKIVEAVKFPPMGKRGLAGERWNAWGLGGDGGETFSERVKHSNQNSVVGVIVESQKGLDALDDILQVPELDFVFVAPTDLSSDMGLHGQIRHPDVMAKVDEAGQTIRAAGIASGMLALNSQEYTYWRQRGFQVLCCVAHNLFMDAASNLMKDIVQHEVRAGGGVPHLRKAALAILAASNLTQDEVESMRTIFEYKDANGDGKFSLEELETALDSGQFSEDVTDKLQSMRQDLVMAVGKQHELLDWKDFFAGSIDEQLLKNQDNLRRAFEELKALQSSSKDVSMSDLTNLFTGEAIAKNIIEQEFDTDGDGCMTFEDFQKAILDKSRR
jgi:2-keto-3-deoxy-L-rhamnonate aldolase RhmA/Ca2+-binding EF-hand superfamily protein